MRVATITRKWLVNTFSFIAVLLLLVVISVSFGFRAFYYNSAQSTLRSCYNSIVSRYFASGTGMGDVRFNEIARTYVESFSMSDTVCVWVMDRNGHVVATTDGFDVPADTKMPDYENALSAESGNSIWTGKSASGEKIMAMTFRLDNTAKENMSAVRYMVSLRQLDGQLMRIIITLILVAVAAMVLAIIPGTVYIDRLVFAIRNTTKAADRIAKGDYETHIDYGVRDEIGDLCDAVHNMAAEIGTAEKLKNDFISTVSHELRTPLTAIRGWGETIRDMGVQDASLAERGMDVILSETTRLGGMVEELLDFSRIQSGRMRLRTVKMDLFAELDEAAFTFQERAVREGKTLTAVVPERAAPYMGDPDRIMQVFVNIIDNALKYTAPGGAINVRAKAQSGDYIITVSDTGKGISEEDLPYIKEKFYKADTTVRGSGIGLAVADEIIRLHGGALKVESVLGTGTTVTILLPVEQKKERSIPDAQTEK